MPTWLTLLGAIFGTAFFFAFFYGVIFSFIGLKQHKARPRLGACPGEKEGTLGFWTHWDVTTFAIQIYRIRVSHFSPLNKVKEGQLSVTFDPVQKAPFIQIIELPQEFRDLLNEPLVKESVITIEAHTTENLAILKNYSLSSLKTIYTGKTEKKMPVITTKLKTVPADLPTVSTLDYGELMARKKKLKDLADQAKAKAAAAATAKAAQAAPPKPASEAATTTATPPAAAAPAATTAVKAAETPPKVETAEKG